VELAASTVSAECPCPELRDRLGRPRHTHQLCAFTFAEDSTAAGLYAAAASAAMFGREWLAAEIESIADQLVRNDAGRQRW
jgi:hypothetical protein